ncbi:MAG TPA: hypothetical protein VNL73_05185 [Verrucomicrobiae bacterium]|nr:hypothetical protein [Verrucomicrobiae bacterium]
MKIRDRSISILIIFGLFFTILFSSIARSKKPKQHVPASTEEVRVIVSELLKYAPQDLRSRNEAQKEKLKAEGKGPLTPTAELRVETYWNGQLDSTDQEWDVVFYRGVEDAKFVILKGDATGKKHIKWESQLLPSTGASIDTVDDLNKDGKHEIVLFFPHRSIVGAQIYTWDGREAVLLPFDDDGKEHSSIGGNDIYFKDMDSDGIAEVIESSRLEIPMDSTYQNTEFVQETKIYRWNGREYQLWEKSRKSLPKPKER